MIRHAKIKRRPALKFQLWPFFTEKKRKERTKTARGKKERAQQWKKEQLVEEEDRIEFSENSIFVSSPLRSFFSLFSSLLFFPQRETVSAQTQVEAAFNRERLSSWFHWTGRRINCIFRWGRRGENGENAFSAASRKNGAAQSSESFFPPRS